MTSIIDIVASLYGILPEFITGVFSFSVDQGKIEIAGITFQFLEVCSKVSRC